MLNSLNAAIADVIDCLDEIATTQMPPPQALAHFHPVRMRHANASVELVWEDQAFDGSLHYDALIRLSGGDEFKGRGVSAIWPADEWRQPHATDRLEFAIAGAYPNRDHLIYSVTL